MRPLLLKGHERPLTKVKFNREGDLLFTCGKDYKPNVWYTDNGERLGTYIGHEGAVLDCDVNFTTTRLLTGSADRTAKIWDVETGKELYSFNHKAGIRSVAFSEGEGLCLCVSDANFGEHATIFVYNLAEDISEQSDEAVRMLQHGSDDRKRITTALWGALNQTVISCGDDGFVRQWDVETGSEIKAVQDHKGTISSMSFSKDKTMIITAGKDKTSRIYDAKTLQCLKTYVSDRPLNSAAISPIFNHVIMGGGQEAKDVTTTAARSGKFEVDFYHLIYQEFLGTVKGHFGPVNSLAFNPDGKSYASGGEDGYVRLHHFDKKYFANKAN
jgi:translation initiation factor 3 subunit I